MIQPIHGPARKASAPKAAGGAVREAKPRAAKASRDPIPRRATLLGAIAGAAAAAIPMIGLRGFTVDDALISAKVAANIARGLGYRFDASGPPSDAVTPLGWAYVLALPSRGDPLLAMYFAKWCGAVAWTLAAAAMGITLSRERGKPLRWAVLIPMLVCAPLACWCVAGMETGVVVALAAFAVLPATTVARLHARSLAIALAVAWRPELVPWALSLALGRSLVSRSSPARTAAAVGFVIGPALAVALVRFAAFGHPLPLAVWAKPSDLEHGIFYALAGVLWCGAPLLVVAPRGVARLDAESRVILVAAAVHLVALVLSGGDWMALFRLHTPILPGLFLVGARLAATAPTWATLVRVGGATVVSVTLLVDKGLAARGVLAQRLALIDAARPLVASAHRVASLDIGWVATAADGAVLDLAGVTDETIARLPGGHTSKHLPDDLLERRGVDALVLLVDGSADPEWARSRWARAVEARAAREAEALPFVLKGTLELRGTRQRYLVLRLQNAP